MAGLSDIFEGAVLEWLFKKTTMPAAATTLYYSLHSADPGDTGASELAASGSYARAQLDGDTNATTHVNYNAIVVNGTAKRVTNKADITFPTATGNWNSSSAIPNWGLWSSLTGGTFYGGGTITGGVIVLNGNTLKFAGGSPGSLSFDVD